MTNKVKERYRFHDLLNKKTNVYFDSFGIEYIPSEVLGKIKDKSTTHNIFRLHSDDSIM